MRRQAIAGETASPYASLTALPQLQASNVPLIPYQSSTILMPIPVASGGNEGPSDNLLSKPLGEMSLRDFESDSNDPFENAALQAIDDMSELQSVLQPQLAPPTGGVDPLTSLYPSVTPQSTTGTDRHSPSADLLVNVGHTCSNEVRTPQPL